MWSRLVGHLPGGIVCCAAGGARTARFCAINRRPPVIPPWPKPTCHRCWRRRLDLPAPLVERLRPEEPRSEGRQTLELLAGAEALRMQILENSCLGLDLDTQPASLPRPTPPTWRQLTFETLPDDIAIEPMAMRVPHECFFVRFGQYTNYIWLNALMEDYGGDIRSMIAVRGVRNSLSQRVQDQLAMEQGILAELLGPQAIADVAMIGMDTFTREGAALGVIFEAENRLLELDLVRQRQEALFRERDNGSALTTVQIAGRDVSFLSTPDNRLRSFYVIDGAYQLVTNSRRIVERFIEVREGVGSLGASPEYRHARASVPTSREDTIFVYFSTAFFENLLSPQYQIELNRRLRAATDLEHITLARLAARNEGQPGDTREQLIATNLLPPGMGSRPDGSGPVMTDTRILDSLRGAQGVFTPVPDLEVAAVSPAEQNRYAVQSAYYAQRWQQLDPLLIAIKRYALSEPGRERITIDAIISPLNDTKYEWYLSLLGEPAKYQLVPPSDSIVSAEAALRGGLLFPNVPPHTLFVGIQDQAPLQNNPLRDCAPIAGDVAHAARLSGRLAQAGVPRLAATQSGGHDRVGRPDTALARNLAVAGTRILRALHGSDHSPECRSPDRLRHSG